MIGPALASAGGLRALTAALNHLIVQHPNAAGRLAAHAGRRVRMGVDTGSMGSMMAAPELWLLIDPAGHLVPATQGEADVQMLLKPSLAAAQALASQGVRGMSPHLRVEGDVLLAGLLGELVTELAWDYEDDLSRVVGDQAAARVGEALRGGERRLREFADRTRDQARNVFDEAMSRDNAAAVGRSAFQSLRSRIGQLSERVADLEQRVRPRK